MTEIKGLDAILFETRPREEQYPTPKQLAWVREHLGEDELDRIIMCNLTRGQVTKMIGDFIEESKRTKRYTHRGYRSGYISAYGSDHSAGDGWGDVGGSGGGWGRDEDDSGHYLDNNWDYPYDGH